jgi:hypothetical protein
LETFIFEGSVLPDALPLTINYRPTIVRREAPESPDAEFGVTVFAGRFQTKVSVPIVTEETIFDLYTPAWTVTEGLVHSAGFIAGIPYTVTIERVILRDGDVRQLQLADRSLARAHGLGADALEKVADLAMLDLPIKLLLSDALKMLGISDYAPIACGRIADGVARLIAPSSKDGARWRQVRETLRVDEAFLRSLTDVSKAPRHADRKYVPGNVNEATANRAWTLLGRFLQFRLEGPLNPDGYPILTTSDDAEAPD